MGIRELANLWIALSLGAIPALAQDIPAPPPQTRFFAGVGVGGLHSPNPHGGKGVYDAMAGVERRLTGGVHFRGTLRRNWIMQSGYVSICHLRADESCWPHPVVPSSHWSLEAAAAFAPGRGIPLSLVTGSGLIKPLRAGHATPESGTYATQVAWRIGVDIGATNGRKGPRIELARTWFPAGLLDISHQTTVSFAIP